MSSRFSPGEFARRYIQEARRRVLSSIPDDLSDDLRKALSATSWLLEIVRNVQMAHTRNKALDAIRQREICVQSEELLREAISVAKDVPEPVLNEIRLAAADREFVSFGKQAEITAFDVVLKEAVRTLMLVEMAKMKKSNLADTLSSYFPSPPSFKEWKSLKAKLEKETFLVSSRRSKKTGDLPVLSETAAIAYEILLELEPYKGQPLQHVQSLSTQDLVPYGSVQHYRRFEIAIATYILWCHHSETTISCMLEGLPYKGLKGTELMEAMVNRGYPTDQSSLTSRIIPKLKPYGIENVPRRGYRIPESKRPTP